MSQLNSFLPAGKAGNPPNASEIPILSELKECYLVWHSFLVPMPKITRNTLGVKVDGFFVDILELGLTAQYTKRDQKLALLLDISRKLDTLKYFITILLEAKGLTGSKYGQLGQKLVSTGKMLGKWIQSIKETR